MERKGMHFTGRMTAGRRNGRHPDDVSRERPTFLEICEVVQLGGLEPPTSCSTDRRSNQLSYNCIACAPGKRGAIWRETRCNARLWQGRNDGAAPLIPRKKART